VKSCSPSKQRFEIGQLRSFILLNVYMMLLSILLLVPLQSNLMCNFTIYIDVFMIWCKGYYEQLGHMINEIQM
jgi:hypothetical protein